MKKCTACGNVQDLGNFCAKCGGSLEDFNANNQSPPNQQQGNVQQPGQPVNNGQFQQPGQTTNPGQFQQAGGPNQFQQPGQFQQQGNPNQQQYQQPAQPNVHVEKVKDQSKAFINFFTTYLKQPSTIFSSGESQFVNGIITVVLYALIVGLTLFVAAHSMFGMFIDTSEIFFNVFGGSAIFIIAIYAVVVLSLWIVAKNFGPETSWKAITSYLGAFSIPSILLTVVALLLFLISAYQFANNILFIALLLVVLAVPLFVITRLLTFQTKNFDMFHSYLVYIIIFLVLFWILMNVVWNNTVGKFMDSGFF
nr:Yip1 family protein [Lysinibacillus timonensis]